MKKFNFLRVLFNKIKIFLTFCIPFQIWDKSVRWFGRGRVALVLLIRKPVYRQHFFYQLPIFCACSNIFHPNHDFVLSLVQKECHWSLCNRKIWNGNFYSRFLFQIFRNSSYVIEKSGIEISIPDFYYRFLETQDFMFPTFIQKIATLTEIGLVKKYYLQFDLTIFQNLGRFLSSFYGFSGPQMCCLWLSRSTEATHFRPGTPEKLSKPASIFLNRQSH